MRLAASSTARCLLTDWRAISRCEHSSPRVWPLRSFRLSSSRRRLGSASALNASSIEGYAAIWLHIIGSQRAACQGPPPRGSRGGPRELERCAEDLEHLTSTIGFARCVRSAREHFDYGVR